MLSALSTKLQVVTFRINLLATSGCNFLPMNEMTYLPYTLSLSHHIYIRGI